MAAWIFPAAMAAGSFLGNVLSGKSAADRQYHQNKKLAAFQNEANERYLQMQLEWDSPVNQMKRFRQAGLNPHLIYGQGSPGNQGTPLRAADIRPADYQSYAQNAGSNAMQTFNQTALTQAQVNATNAKTEQTTVLAGLQRLQAKVIAANPLLNDAGFKATIDSLVSAAQIKAAQAGIQKNIAEWQPIVSQKAAEKLQEEIKLLDQRFNLGEQDKKIKAEILKSKEFQNAILEIQKKWMADGEMTPQHFFQLISQLLMKAL